MAGFERTVLDEAERLVASPVSERYIDAISLGATLLPEGKAVKIAERALPEIWAAEHYVTFAGQIDCETEALMKLASMREAPVYAPTLWTTKPVVAHTFHAHMNVPSWGEFDIYGEKPDVRQLTSTVTSDADEERIAQIAAARLPIVQAASDALTDSRGLARAKFQLGEGSLSNGSYLLGTDTIELTPKYLAEQSIAKVAATTGHELTHYEQAHLLVRSIADEVGAGAVTTPREAEAIRGQFQQDFGTTLEKRVFANIMAKRAGITLSDRERDRALILRTCIPAGQKLAGLEVEAEHDEKDLRSLLGGINSNSSAAIAAPMEDFHYWSDKPGSTMFRLMERNPGIREIVSSLKFDRFGELRPMSNNATSALKERLVPVARHGIESALFRQDALFDAYLDRYDEVEARSVGDKLYKQVMRIQRRAGN